MLRARILSSFVHVLIAEGIGFFFYKYTLQLHATGTQIASKKGEDLLAQVSNILCRSFRFVSFHLYRIKYRIRI